jgi:hypothetical protein
MGNQVLLILSDGNDTGSTHSLSAALEEVQRSGAVVYCIRYQGSAGTADSQDGLDRLAHETGGLVFDFPAAGYSEILSRIEADLRGRYIPGFRPGPARGKTQSHSLRVETVRPGLTVRARQEYQDR